MRSAERCGERGIGDRQPESVGAHHVDAGAGDWETAGVDHVTVQRSPAEKRHRDRLARARGHRHERTRNEAVGARAERRRAVADRSQGDAPVRGGAAEQRKRPNSAWREHDVGGRDERWARAVPVGDDSGHEAAGGHDQGHLRIRSALEREAD